MGRNGKPISLHLAEGNPNRLTKAEIQARKDNEIKLGKSELDSEYEKLLNQYQKLEKIAINQDVFEEYFEGIYEKAAANDEDVRVFGLKAQMYLSQLASIEGILKIETAINKKMDMLIKMQDRLFLNPLSKVKSVPKPKKEEKPASKFGKFGAGRGG
ncbi:terminase [Brevibacillus brevis]|uniref:terminase n=1 Tax=Brevibacillus brevis TaxID=1393 RepID=UPI001C8E1D82|nr:terminase [Brevibacillus brevis]